MGLIPHDNKNNPFPHGLSIRGFKKLNKYTYDIISVLMLDQDLLKLLKYNSENPLNEKDIDTDIEEILYKYIYPYKKDTDTTKEVKSSIRVYFKGGLRDGDVLKNNSLIVDVLVPSQAMIISSGTRDIEIMDRVDRILNNARGIGLGQINFKGFWQIEDKDSLGYTMVYEIKTLK